MLQLGLIWAKSKRTTLRAESELSHLPASGPRVHALTCPGSLPMLPLTIGAACYPTLSVYTHVAGRGLRVHCYTLNKLLICTLTHVTLVNSFIALQETNSANYQPSPEPRSLSHLILSTTTIPVYATAIYARSLTDRRRRPQPGTFLQRLDIFAPSDYRATQYHFPHLKRCIQTQSQRESVAWRQAKSWVRSQPQKVD
jgi:hypothetical protein